MTAMASCAHGAVMDEDLPLIRARSRVCGLDEAGRGALAGPVVAAAVVFCGEALDLDPVPGLADSKVLSAKRREALYEALVSAPMVRIGIGVVGPDDIDRLNILQASCLAMELALEQVALTCESTCESALPVLIESVLVDGNYLSGGMSRRCATRGFELGSVVKGDAKVSQISAASIVAKVTRDRLMVEMDATHPGYGFAVHSGYPSPAHLSRLRELGPSPSHRMSFGPVAALRRAAAP